MPAMTVEERTRRFPVGTSHGMIEDMDTVQEHVDLADILLELRDLHRSGAQGRRLPVDVAWCQAALARGRARGLVPGWKPENVHGILRTYAQRCPPVQYEKRTCIALRPRSVACERHPEGPAQLHALARVGT